MDQFDWIEDPVVQLKMKSAIEFTRAYKSHIRSHVAEREAACLARQYPALCREIREQDLLAGRIHYTPLIGFAIEYIANLEIEILRKDRCPDNSLSADERNIRDTFFTTYCGFCFDYSSLKTLASMAPNKRQRFEIEELIDFWTTESMAYKYRHALPEEIKKGFGRVAQECQVASTFFRICCLSLDYDVLLRLGIPGLQEKIEKQYKTADDPGLARGMLQALDTLIAVCEHYRLQALELFEETPQGKRKAELQRLSSALKNIQTKKPDSLLEAMQLFWLWNLMADTINFGRMDVYLGDFYVRDLERGIETEESAQELINSLWRIISQQADEGNGSYRFNSRIILGGRGRRNEAHADCFALAALDATMQLKVCEPTVTLRFYSRQNPALMNKALQCIAAGCVHPTLYNDDRHIPMIQKAYDVTPDEAERYLPQGCGEINIDGMSIGSPNNIINLVATLDLVLHNGFSTETQEMRGLPLGTIDDFDTFDKLVTAFKKQVDYTNGLFARRHAIEYRIHAENAAYLFISMLTADCIETNRACFNGGTRYLGGTIETFGLTNVCDSLIAIKDLVYDKSQLTLKQVVEACDTNFNGCENIRQMLLSAPKFGNDIDIIDRFHKEMSEWVCYNAHEKAKPAGLHYLLNCNLNPDGIRYAINTKASPDGRFYGEAFAVGCAPSAGRDTHGITALLNSMSNHDELHSGYVHNLKVGHSMFDPRHIGAFRALLDAYFENGGWQLMVTVLNPDDLQKAVKNPEKYTHIMVRVGGWTARFVDLPKTHQIEILQRTLYC
ncbi:MAG: pyruvate formate lyase family protein [Kiritimatiellales bacterium]